MGVYLHMRSLNRSTVQSKIWKKQILFLSYLRLYKFAWAILQVLEVFKDFSRSISRSGPLRAISFFSTPGCK